MPTVTINYTPSDKQNLFHAATEFETLLVGGRGSCKTWGGVMECYLLSIDFPGNVGLMLRKRQVDFVATTLASWKKVIPSECYHINEQQHIITVFTGKLDENGKPLNSIIYYAGADDEKAVKKYRGSEFGFILFDQAEEFNLADISELIPCMRHKLPSGVSPHYRVMYLANPQQSYILTKFKQHKTDKMKLIQVSTFDNPFREAGYIDILTDLYKDRPEDYKAMVLGDIDIADAPDMIIPFSKIEAAMKRRQKLAFFDKRIISIDVAREGNDGTVILGWEGCLVVEREAYGKKDLDVTAAKAIAMQRRVGANAIIWDSDGIGGGLMSHFKGLAVPGTKLIEFHGSGKSEDERYLNQRSEAWFEAAELFNNDLPAFYAEIPTMRDQLGAVTYEYRLGKLKVQDKADIKLNIGQSPDDADAYVYGVYGLKRAPSIYQSMPVEKGTMAELIKTISDDEEIEEGYPTIGNHSVQKW